MDYFVDSIIKFLKELLFLTNEMAIYLILGFFIAGLIHAFLPQDLIKTQIGKKGFLSSLKSALLGVPMPLCSCGVVPTALSLKKNGASNGAVVSFLISTPQTGIDSIMATYGLFGRFFAFFRVVVAFITGVVGGFITDLIDGEKEFGKENPDVDLKENLCCGGSCAVPENSVLEKSFLAKLKDAFSYGFGELLDSIARWVLIGLVIGALISALLPENFFTLYLSNGFLTYALVLLVSIPVYVCATGSIPIAASLVLKGISPGAAFVFLMAGPATNSVSFTVLYKTIGRKATFVYLATIVVGALLGGIIIDFFFFDIAIKEVFVNNSTSSLSYFKIFGTVVFAILLLKSLIFKGANKKEIHSLPTEKKNNKNIKSFKVDGMTCNHCKMTVSNILGEIQGIEWYSISLEERTVVVKGDFDLNLLKELLEKEGYSLETV